MEKRAFTTSDIAQISHHSRETVKRWVEKGEIKGYRVGKSGHWRVLPKDLALFLKDNNIPFPEPEEVDVDLKALMDREALPTFCWEFYRDKMNEHVRPDRSCEECLVYKVKSINCYALRDEVKHKKIYCVHSCEDCAYFHFQHKEILSGI
jgi:excisionase family DNA binding protein